MENRIKLAEKRNEAKGTKTFIFDKPDAFDYKAGQYVYLTLDKLNYPDERGNTRHFTLSSSPTEKFLSVTVRIREQSGFKKTLDELPLGAEVNLRGPRGEFVLENEKAQDQQVFIAGGIGITPFRSIIKYTVESKLDIPIHLIYSNSLPEEITFKEELDNTQSNNKNLKIDYTITKPEESSLPWGDHKGRIDTDYLSLLTTYYSLPAFWVCGPPAFVDAIEEALQKLNIPKERIKTDKFTGY